MNIPMTAAESTAAQRMAAGALAAAGLTRGDRIVLSLPGSPAYVSAVLGATRTGIVPVPLDPRLTTHEFTQIVDDVEPALVVRELAEFGELLAGPERELAEWPLCRPMHFTSGTTGRPKGVWSGVLNEDDARNLALEERELWRFTPEDTNLVVSPLYHSAPLRFAAGTVLAGGSIVVLPMGAPPAGSMTPARGGFEPQAFADAVEQFAPTTMFCVPAHLQRLFAWQDETGDARDLGTFRLVAHAGAPCPDSIRRRAHDTFGVDTVWEFYGSTEGQWTACRADDWQAHPGTVGRARPGRIITADDDGLLWCAVPPWATFEYWRGEEKTAAAWKVTPDGPAFTVGDLGRVEDGWVYLDGRRTDLIITGGVNVYPAEIESVLAEVPGVTDIAVFGRDDESWGQRVCAAYVGDATEEALRDRARERLSPPKRPKQYIRMERLPRTATGKVRRHEL